MIVEYEICHVPFHGYPYKIDPLLMQCAYCLMRKLNGGSGCVLNLEKEASRTTQEAGSKCIDRTKYRVTIERIEE